RPARTVAAGRLRLGGALVLRHRVVRQDFALEDPDLDAAGAVGGVGAAVAEIDVGAQRVQRHAALAIPLHSRDLGAAEAAGAVDADAAGAEAHRRLHGALHGAAEGDAALQLLGDAVGDQLGVDLGLADLDDVETDLALRHLGDVGAQLLDVRALLADDDAGARRMDGDARLLGGALDDDAADPRLRQALDEELAQTQVLVQQRAVVAPREPPRVPGAVDAEAQTGRMDLLTHVSLLLRRRFFGALAHDHGEIAEIFFDSPGAAAAARVEALHRERAADRRLLDEQPVDVELMIVLGIGDRRLQHLLHVLCDAARREGQLGERARRALAAYALGDEVELARADADDAQERLGFGLVETA